MTIAFDKFIEQNNSTGSKKVNGYDNSHFDGMTTSEKSNAFDLLKKEFIAPGVIEWMFYLNSSKTEKLLEEHLKSIDKNNMEGVHRIYASLYKHTSNEKYRDLLIDNYEHYPESEKRQALWMINRTKPDKEKVLPLYESIINSPQPSKALPTAADFYLRLHQQPFETEEDKSEFYRIRKMLESGDSEIKARGMSSIKGKAVF
jgi:hypothetical protein